jgi:anti-sigma-K factor RskA
MSREMRNPENSNDLEWLAFCYVADELENSDREQFELRLENDNEAREAVVTAMQNAEMLWLAYDEQSALDGQTHATRRTSLVKANRKTLLRRSGSLFAAAAAMLLMVAGWGWWSNQAGTASPVASESETLAVVLAELYEEQPIEEIIESMEIEEIEIAAADYGDEEFSDWMYVALTDLEGGMEGVEQ